MDVLVCGAQKPFMRGGAELHQEALVAALQAAGHKAELVRVPVAWEKDRLFDAPLAWRLLPCDADLVIATNFPSYYVRHPRKVVWLFHQHRGAFDLADASFSDIGTDDVSLEVQQTLTEWDARALGEAERLYTTSGVVAQRLAAFTGLTGRPLAHPPPLSDRLHPGEFGDYVFCPTRLEENKRPRLLVEGLAAAGADARLVLAGTGGQHEELVALAAERGVADRLRLPGFVPDDELVELYANALAVAYLPLDEDYGYVTLQAFFAGKPVVTSTDAGGVLEWVEDGVTGLVTDGSPGAVGEAYDRLRRDPALARRLGEEGRRRVAGLRWEPVVAELLGS